MTWGVQIMESFYHKNWPSFCYDKYPEYSTSTLRVTVEERSKEMMMGMHFARFKVKERVDRPITFIMSRYFIISQVVYAGFLGKLKRR